MSNTPSILSALVWQAAFALYPGALFLRGLGLWPRQQPLLAYPLACACGLLIVPLSWHIIAAIGGGSLSLLGRFVVWIALTAVLLALSRFTHQYAARDGTFWPALALWSLGLIAAAIVFHPLSVHGLPTADGKRYGHTSVSDWSKHIAVTVAIATSDTLPHPHPFLSTDSQMLYYYGAYLLPAFVHRIQPHLGLANQVIASAMLIAFSFPFALYYCGRKSGLSRSGALVACGLATLVSGWDYIYMVISYRQTGYWPSHIDGWVDHATRRINSIPDLFIWTPQHILGLTACLLVLVCIVHWRQHQDMREQWQSAVGLAIFLAALSITSSLIWLVLMSGLALYIVYESLRDLRHRRWPRSLMLGFGMGASVMLSAPLLLHMLASNRPETRPIVLSISPTRTGAIYGGIFSEIFGPNALAYALDFPLQMLPEFGILLILGLAGWSGRWREWGRRPDYRLWTILLVWSFCFVLAVREGRSDTNNYAPRAGSMVAMFLALLAGLWWERRRMSRWWRWRALRGFLGVGLLIGFATTLYEPIIQRQQLSYISADEYALYAWMNTHLKTDDVFQMGKQQYGDQLNPSPMYFVERRAGFADPLLAEAFTAHMGRYQQALTAIIQGYRHTDAAVSARAFASVGITHVVAGKDIILPSNTDVQFGRYFKLVYENGTYALYSIHP